LKSSIISSIAALLLVISGGLFALYYLLFDPEPYLSIVAASFLDTIAIPFDLVQIGPVSFPIKVDNFLVFQEFKSLPPTIPTHLSLLYAVIVWLATIWILTLVTELKKFYFIVAGIIWIILITFSNFNGLNIGGPSTNNPLIILLAGTGIPLICFHIWGERIRLLLKGFILMLSTSGSIALMVYLSPIPNATLYVAEHSLFIGFGLALAWVFWNGHAVLSGIYVLLARANRNLNLNIAVQIGLVALVYLIALFFILLSLTGEVNLPFPIFSPLYLIIPMGIFGWFSIKEKIGQSDELVASPRTVQLLHLLGFGLSAWLIWKLKISGNQPAEELLKHVLLYSQVGFSLFFMIYVYANFLSIMNSGKAVEKVLYKPHSLVYYHIRIGGLIVLLVLTTYTGGIIGIQASAMTTNILADYYYQSDQKLEASILYESSWARYHRNPKAKNTAAHLLLELNQPTQAVQHLEESFAETPQVDNILLLSDRLHRENRIFEAVYYLERGLILFPDNEYIQNNLSLLYTKLNRDKEAMALLDEPDIDHPAVLANRIALKSKLGQPDNQSEISTDLIAQINQLATLNLLGNMAPKGLVASIETGVKKENSPMLLLAGLRNSWSDKDRTDPAQDLIVLDSLSHLPKMIDYISDLEETGVIRSLGAGRVTEAVKNLNGLAFRNPGSAGYYLQLSGMILAQNLDFQKAANELIAAEEKGFKAFDTHHWSIFGMAGLPDKALEIRQKYEVTLPAYLTEEESIIPAYLNLIGTFNRKPPLYLYDQWRTFPDNELKTDIAIRLIAAKSHGLDAAQLNDLEKYISTHLGENLNLKNFVSNPDLTKADAVDAFIRWINASNELTANPYLTPLIISAINSNSDPLLKYEILNAASEFNYDPILWLRKIEAAKAIGLENYADDARKQLQGWVTLEELATIPNINK